MTTMNHELAVIGNDEAAFETLFLAAASGKRAVAFLPVTRHSSWLVGQALRRLVSNLLVDRTPRRSRMFQKSATPRLLQALVARSIAAEVLDRISVLKSAGVDVVLGEVQFSEQHSSAGFKILQCGADTFHVDNIVIGTGVRRTAMHLPVGLVPFHRPESLFLGKALPTSVCIFGGGNFGAGLAALTSLFGVSTRHIAREDRDSVMLELAAAAGVQIGHQSPDSEFANLARRFADMHSDVVDCRRVVGFTDHLNLSAINVDPDENGQLWCASHFETWCGGVFGVGEVVGFSPDSSLHASVQAERVVNRIMRSTKRPHMLESFSRSSLTV